MGMMSDGKTKKQHIVYLTTDEIKAVANMYRVARKMGGGIPYVESLDAAGKSAYDKLLKKIKEINGD